jgi:hypothetical protein
MKFRDILLSMVLTVMSDFNLVVNKWGAARILIGLLPKMLGQQLRHTPYQKQKMSPQQKSETRSH